MTDTPSHWMTAERLEEVRAFIVHPYPSVKVQSNLPLELLAHIDAQAAEIERVLSLLQRSSEQQIALKQEIERLTRERDIARLALDGNDGAHRGLIREFDRAEAAKAKLAALSAPVGDGEVKRLVEWLSTPLFEGEDAPVEHAEAATLIRRLASSLARARDALTKLAGFDYSTPDKITIAREALAALEPRK
jgi:hypothetical protein